MNVAALVAPLKDTRRVDLLSARSASLRLWTGMFLLAMGSIGVIGIFLRSIGYLNPELDFYMLYVPVARRLLQGVLLLDQYKGPGYEGALALVHLVFGEYFRAAVILSMLSASALLVVLFYTMQNTYGRDAALLTCAGVAVNQTFLALSLAAGTDMLFALLVMCVLFLLTRREQISWPSALLAGVIAGYAYLTRYNGIATIAAAGLSLLVLCSESTPWKRRLVSLLVFCAGVAMLVVPFGIYSFRHTGHFIENLNYLNVAYEIYARQTVFWNDYWRQIAPYFHSLTDVIALDPPKFFMRVAENAVAFGWKDLSLLVAVPVGLLALGGIVVEFVGGFTRRQAIPVLFAIFAFLVLVPVFYEERFSLFLVPFVVLFAVRFLQWLGARTVRQFPWTTIARVLGLMVFVWSLTLGVLGVRDLLAAEPREILHTRDVFLTLSPEDQRGDKVAARKPQMPYYLGKEYVFFPSTNSVDEFISVLRQNNIRFVYFREVDVKLSPELAGLLHPHEAHPGLRPLVVTEKPLTVLYKVEP